MISLSEFHFFDPQEMKASILPDKPGNYLVILRSSSLLPQCSRIHFTPKLTSLEYSAKNYQIIYIGNSKKCLRFRVYRQHLLGNSGVSVLRKSISCLMGLQLIPSSTNGKAKFCEEDEKCLTDWMIKNLLFLYYANDEYKFVEKELIITYHPPLNLQNNRDGINADFRKALSALQSLASNDNDCHAINTFCPNCNMSLIVADELKDEEYIKCMSCGHIFKNPLYEYVARNAKKKKWKWPMIFLAICFALFLLSKAGEHSNGNYGSIDSQNGPSNTEAMAGVRTYLKHHYLKDPDSYRSMNWGPSGIYSKENNTYFMMHKFRAKNSYGGYVIEEWLFVLNTDGRVVKMINDINDVK